MVCDEGQALPRPHGDRDIGGLLHGFRAGFRVEGFRVEGLRVQG